eukprot:jgi/Pico_ML_1/54301/g4670.t2
MIWLQFQGFFAVFYACFIFLQQASQQLDLQALYGGEENCVATFTIAIASFHVVHVASPFETIHPMGSNPKRLPSL